MNQQFRHLTAFTLLLLSLCLPALSLDGCKDSSVAPKEYPTFAPADSIILQHPERVVEMQVSRGILYVLAPPYLFSYAASVPPLSLDSLNVATLSDVFPTLLLDSVRSLCYLGSHDSTSIIDLGPHGELALRNRAGIPTEYRSDGHTVGYSFDRLYVAFHGSLKAYDLNTPEIPVSVGTKATGIRQLVVVDSLVIGANTGQYPSYLCIHGANLDTIDSVKFGAGGLEILGQFSTTEKAAAVVRDWSNLYWVTCEGARLNLNPSIRDTMYPEVTRVFQAGEYVVQDIRGGKAVLKHMLPNLATRPAPLGYLQHQSNLTQVCSAGNILFVADSTGIQVYSISGD